jgi:hypothetical protein
VLHRSGRDTRSVFVSSLLSSGSSDAGDQGDVELIDDGSIVISSEPEQLAIDIDININVTQQCEEKELKSN